MGNFRAVRLSDCFVCVVGNVTIPHRFADLVHRGGIVAILSSEMSIEIVSKLKLSKCIEWKMALKILIQRRGAQVEEAAVVDGSDRKQILNR